ncbi:Fungal specific transcription factor domain [Ceratobasidium sp. AG-Ba]|nr:Fungal specific transcription factor domain [Ceratobasidium sp. AG-Ba]QRW03848.1 Fungal specific transcription factor domain [Ceratobasidium sp. AG-Ba]
MSSGEDDDYENQREFEGANVKKRRVQRACDVCRRKKVRCDGATRPGNRCSNCIAFNFECTYVEAAKKRGPPKGYVESLENRLEKMERLLQRLCPGADFTQSLGQHLTREQWEAQRGGKTNLPPKPKNAQPPPATPTNPLAGTRGTSTIEPPEPTKEEDLISSDEESNLVNGMQKLSVTTFERRFHGKSSGLMLVKAARSLKQEYVNAENIDADQPQQSRRPEFWRANPWEWIDTEDPLWKDKVQPPPADLRDSLIDLFFTHVNAFFPLLHRPLFEHHIQEELHFKDSAFACVLLLVCAVGSRWSNDRRVFLEKDEPLQHSAGWKFFEQVQYLRRSLLTPPKLYDLQVMVLAVMFLQGTSAPHSAWTVAGIGIRIAQDVGAHRRKVYRGGQGSIEDELWKRAFWILVVHDRVTSSALGRPCAIQDEDSDVGFPVEVDDEYWPHNPADLNFVPTQPAGVPARVAFFNCYLRLIQILGFALRTIYSINKSKILLGFVGPQWEQHIVAELDSALNKWIDSVPDHLRWDPNRENPLFFDQSATLYSTYYHVQILIHRPFIPSRE